MAFVVGMTAKAPRLLEDVRAAIRARHYSRRTEEAYVHWIRRFIVFHGRRHPRELGAEEIAAFVTWLAVEQGVAASTLNQALRGILFLYIIVAVQCERWCFSTGHSGCPRIRTWCLPRRNRSRLLHPETMLLSDVVRCGLTSAYSRPRPAH